MRIQISNVGKLCNKNLKHPFEEYMKDLAELKDVFDLKQKSSLRDGQIS